MRSNSKTANWSGTWLEQLCKESMIRRDMESVQRRRRSKKCAAINAMVGEAEKKTSPTKDGVGVS